MFRRTFLALMTLALCSCGSSTTISSPQPIVFVLPASGTKLALDAASTSGLVTVSESNYRGAFTASSSNRAVATVSVPASQSASTATFTVFAKHDGEATIAIADDAGHSSSFTVSVGELASPSPSPTPKATPAPTATPMPTASPTATPTPGPLSASTSALTFNGLAETRSVTLSDPGTVSFTLSGCAGVATHGAVANDTFEVTSLAPGSCALVASDAFAHHVTISVSVTTLGVPIQ